MITLTTTVAVVGRTSANGRRDRRSGGVKVKEELSEKKI